MKKITFEIEHDEELEVMTELSAILFSAAFTKAQVCRMLDYLQKRNLEREDNEF